MIQLFFIILKSAVDYGTSIYTKLKAKTTVEKFAKLIRVNLKKTLRLKQSTPDKVIYELIGRPELEWQRRLKEIEKSKEELKQDEDYINHQILRKERRELRKILTWEANYVASIWLCKDDVKIA